jgi:hypothetical protein
VHNKGMGSFLLSTAQTLGSYISSGVSFMLSRSPSKHLFHSLTFPNQLSPEQAADFWNSVASTFASSSLLPDYQETVVVEIRSDMHGLTHRLGIPWQHSALLDKLRSHVPGIHIEEKPVDNQPNWTRAHEVGISDRTRLLDVQHIESVTRSIMSAMSHDVKPGDHLAVQIVINPIGREKQVSEAKPHVSSHPSAWALIYGSMADREEVKERRTKLAENQFKIVLRFVAASTTEARAEWLMNNVRKSYHEMNSSTAHFTRRLMKRDKIIDRFNAAAGLFIYPAQVNVTELTALSAWPIGGPMIPGLTLGKTQYLPPNATILKEGRRLGLSYQDRPIAISAEEACRHMYVIGPSGLGKTTLLANALQQDMERGYGAVVMESKGDLFNAAINAVPRERIGDVVVMNLADSEWPVGVNVLAGKNRNAVVDAMTNLFAQGTGGDIYFRDLMYHGLHAICATPGLTIADLVPFLYPQSPMEKSWRESIVNNLKKTAPEFYQYWKGFDMLKATEQRQRIQPVLNRLWQISSRRDIRNLLGQSESTIDFRAIMRDNKLLFIYLPDSIGDETVSLLTSLLFKEMWDAVREVRDEKTKPTYLYLDEMQKLKGYINLTEVLSLARSYKFGLVMAHQYKSQLSPELQSAITNAATMVSFKLDGPDANWIQSLMGKSVTPDDFMNLGPYEVIARLAINGGSSSPTFFKTLPQLPAHNYGVQVVEESRKHYARTAESVDKEILKRRSAPSEPVKAKPSFGYMRKDDE